MDIILNTTILGLIFGTLGTTLGGIIGVSIKTQSNKFLSFILEFAAGLMVAIVCFELIPEAMELSSIFTVIIGIILGANLGFLFLVILSLAKQEDIYIENEGGKHE